MAQRTPNLFFALNYCKPRTNQRQGSRPPQGAFTLNSFLLRLDRRSAPGRYKDGPGWFHFFRLRPSLSGTSNRRAFIFR
jgi:hypothetical protein